jgi:hypothetical protein
MLQAPDSPWGLSKDGKRQNVLPSLQLAPELNIEQMSEAPGHLLGLFKARAHHAQQLAALEREHGFHMFQGDLEARDLDYLARLYGGSRAIPKRSNQRGRDFHIVTGDAAGRYTQETPMPSLQSMLDNGYAIEADVADDTLLRQLMLLAALTVFGDGYRQDVLGKLGSKYTATALGCASCAAGQKQGGGKLQLCASCGVVAYCSKRCQAAHWKAGHKAVCSRRPGC